MKASIDKSEVIGRVVAPSSKSMFSHCSPNISDIRKPPKAPKIIAAILIVVGIPLLFYLDDRKKERQRLLNERKK